MLFEGIHVPLTTPFYPDGRVYLRKLEHNVRRLSLTPVSGLILLGPNSENATLTTEEKRTILATAAAAAAPEKVLVASIAEAGVHPAVELAEHAAATLYDAILLAAPPADELRFWHDGKRAGEPTEELLAWFRSIADQSRLPVLLASHAAGQDLPVSTVAALAEHPNVIGLLEQSTHVSRVVALKAATAHIQRTSTTTTTFAAATRRMLQPPPPPTPTGTLLSAESLAIGGTAIAIAPPAPTLKTRTKATGFQLLWSHAHDSTQALHAGASALAPQVSASIPGAVFEIWAAYKDGDTSLMHEKQQRVSTAAEPYLLQQGTPAIKAAAELSGYFGGRPRLPQFAPTAEVQAHIAHLLDGMRS